MGEQTSKVDKKRRRSVLKTVKQRGRKVIATVVTLLLALVMLPAAVFAAPGVAEVSVGQPLEGIPAEGLSPGDVITIPVMLADNPGIAAFNFRVEYDTTVFEFIPNSVSTASPAITATWVLTDKNASVGTGFLAVNGTHSFTGQTSDNGRLYSFQLVVLSDAPAGDSSITIRLTGAGTGNPNNFVNALLEQVPVNFTPLSVKIKDTSTPPVLPAKVAVADVAGSYKPGESFSVPVTIEDNPGFAGAVFNLGFDSTALELVGFTADGALLDGALLVDVPTAMVGYAGHGGGIDVISADGVLFKANFVVKAGAAVGNYPITIGLKNGNALNFVDDSSLPLDVGFTAGSVNVAAAGPVYSDTTIVVGSLSAEPGQTITVPVYAKASAGFSNAAFQIDYDHSVLTLVNAIKGVDLPTGSFFLPVPPENDRVAIMGITNIVGDVKLFDLVFEVNASALEGNSTISLSIYNPTEKNFNNTDGDDVTVAFEAGIISVEPVLEIDIPDDLDMPAFDSGTTWIRTYNGSPQPISIGLLVGGGSGTVTVYYDGSATAPTVVGNYPVTITVSGVPGYRAITTPVAVGTLSIVKAPAPAITWPTASSITYGQALSDVVLSGGTTGFGSFAWDASVVLTETPDAGTYYYPVVFTPNANTLQNYEAISPLTQNVEVIVNKIAAPVISEWPTASTIRQGQNLSASTLSITSNAYGTFAWTNGSLTPLAPGGLYEVTFTPSAATAKNYAAITIVTKDIMVKVVLPGDVDGSGEVSTLDAMRILQHIAAHITLTGDALIAADVDGDGDITSADAILAARYAIGLG